MTDDEKRQQKGELLLSFQEAQDNAAALREKIREMSSKLRGVQAWLDRLANTSYSRDLLHMEFYSPAHATTISVIEDASFRSAMDYDQVVSLTQEMIAAIKRIEDLASRKRDLGLK